MVFRYDINALRAIAVIGVILFHYKVPYFDGGFCGVDVFFVISGYLMTKIIIGGMRENTFSLKNFYSSRLKRIVPALLALISALSVIAFFFYFPADFKSFQTNAAASIAFLSNILYYKSSNYFAPSSDTKLLIHTWSLSVEWQFYLLYPVILLGSDKILQKKNWYLIGFILTIVVIFLLSVYYYTRNQTGAFYLLPTRSWEMLVGGIAFLLEGVSHKFKYRKIMAAAMYTGILLCFLLLHNEFSWPGKFTLLPVGFTLAIIILNVNDLEILKNRAVQFTGRISYSLYLWHWPVLVLARNIGTDLDVVSVTTCLIISFILAYFSYRYIELVKNRSDKSILIAMVALFGLCMGGSYFAVNSVLFKPETLEIASYNEKYVKERMAQFNEGCFITTDKLGINELIEKGCLNLDSGRKNVLLIGDSHAAHLSASLKEALHKKNVNMMQATISGCLPVIKSSGKDGCVELINHIYKNFISSNAHKLDGVIISANWIMGHINPEELLTNLNYTIAHMQNHAVETIIIGQNETYKISYPFIAAREFQYNLDLSERYTDTKSHQINNFLKGKLEPYYVDIYHYGKIPGLTAGKTPYMFDTDHYTRYGADLTVEAILAHPVAQSIID